MPLLVRHFVRQLSDEMGSEPVAVSEAALRSLCEYDYPGNVREPRNLVERALIESRGRDIDVAHLHFAPPASSASMAGGEAAVDGPEEEFLDLDAAVAWAEARVVACALARCGGNLTEAARLLRTSRNRLYRVRRREG